MEEYHPTASLITTKYTSFRNASDKLTQKRALYKELCRLRHQLALSPLNLIFFVWFFLNRLESVPNFVDNILNNIRLAIDVHRT